MILRQKPGHKNSFELNFLEFADSGNVEKIEKNLIFMICFWNIFDVARQNKNNIARHATHGCNRTYLKRMAIVLLHVHTKNTLKTVYYFCTFINAFSKSLSN